MRLSKIAAAAVVILVGAVSANAEEVRIGVCTPVIDASVGAPFAAATEFGWFSERGISVKVLPLAGSTDCVLAVATDKVKAALVAPESVALMATKGTKIQIFYTVFNRNMFGIAVPKDSPIKSYADLKDKRIGVVSMSSVGVVIARAALESTGLNPDTDAKIVVSGPPVQSNVLLKSGQIDALSQWDMFYEILTSIGLPMRKLMDPGIDDFPSNGFATISSVIEKDGDVLAAIGRGYAMGTLYMMERPEEAARLFFKHNPDKLAPGLSLDENVARSLPAMRAASRLRALADGQKQWGYSDPKKYQNYIDWLAKHGTPIAKVQSQEIINNSLLDKINSFDPKAVTNAR